MQRMRAFDILPYAASASTARQRWRLRSCTGTSLLTCLRSDTERHDGHQCLELHVGHRSWHRLGGRPREPNGRCTPGLAIHHRCLQPSYSQEIRLF